MSTTRNACSRRRSASVLTPSRVAPSSSAANNSTIAGTSSTTASRSTTVELGTGRCATTITFGASHLAVLLTISY